MKLKWSQNSDGNWNGKAGPYTLMTVAYHGAWMESNWWVHPKLPGVRGHRVEDEKSGKEAGDRLFAEWLSATGIHQ